MIKRALMFLFMFLVSFFCTDVYALENDLLQGFDIIDNGDGTIIIDGWMMSHKSDNSNYTYYACDNFNNCKKLERNDNESRTDMNTEVTMGEVYNYDNIGVNATIPSNYVNLVIKNGNTEISRGKLIDKNSTDSGIKIAGTQCDLRNESGNRSNGDFSHFATGEIFSINSVKENVKTDKGDIVTMYCLNVSTKTTQKNGHTYYHEGNGGVACVFDSCGSLVENAPLKPSEPEPGWKPSVCDENSGFFGGCSMNDGSISSCGGGTTHSCNDGKYTTGRIYSPSKISGWELVDASYNDCASATCSYSQTDIFRLNVNMPEGNYNYNGKNYFRAGTYFDNPSISYSVNSSFYDVSKGSCPSWQYRRKETGTFDDSSYCTSKGDDLISMRATTCTDYVNGVSVSILPSKSCSQTCDKAGYDIGRNSLFGDGCSCYNIETYTCYNCTYWNKQTFESEECSSSLDSRCQYEIKKATSSSYISGSGTAKFATDSNSVKNNIRYSIPFNFRGSRFLQNVAYVNKKSGLVYYEPTNLSVSRPEPDNVNLYNIYNNVHFIPLDYPTGNYGTQFNASFDVSSSGSGYSIDLFAECGVPVINLYKPTPSNDGDNSSSDLCSKEPCGYGFIYRPIDLNNPFPNSVVDLLGNGKRGIGDNWYTWINNDDNRRKLSSAYTNGPDYVVYLDNSLISQIRTYNKNKDDDGVGYLDLSIGVDGSSEFFKENSFVCTTVNGNDNNTTLCSRNPSYFGLGINKVWGAG